MDSMGFLLNLLSLFLLSPSIGRLTLTFPPSALSFLYLPLLEPT